MKNSAFIFLAMVIFVTGCNKDPKRLTPNENAWIKNEISMGDTITYVYDANHRVIEIIDYPERATFQYTPGAIIKTKTIFNLIIKDTLFLNSEGLIIKEAGYNYTYDSEGHCTAGYDSSGSRHLTYTDGNLMQVSYTGGFDPNLLITYDYLTDMANTISNTNKGLPARGKESANLVNTETWQSPTTGDVIFQYSYEYDELGRVIEKTYHNGSNSGTTYYTYY
jgi:YD repeat-containing protein